MAFIFKILESQIITLLIIKTNAKKYMKNLIKTSKNQQFFLF